MLQVRAVHFSFQFLVSWQRPILGALLLVCTLAMRAAAEERPAAPQPDSGAAKPATVDPKSATPADIQKWIRELNDDSYSIRQAAATRLLSAGPPAREALVALAEGPDPETRAAARRLVALIDRTDFNRRLEAFAADTDGKRGITLPGWDKFRKLVGSDPAARALFVDMQRAEGALLASAFGVSGNPSDRLLEERLNRLLTWQVTAGNRTASPPLGSCATMMFLGAVSEVEISERGATSIDILVQRPPINESLTAGGEKDAVRRLVVGWLLHCPNRSESSIQRRLNIVSGLNLKEALPLAVRIVRRDKEYADASASLRSEALLLIGQFGGREHVGVVEPLLEDESLCMPRQFVQPGQAATLQVRDVALLVLLHLTGQKPAEYGYQQAGPPRQQPFPLQFMIAPTDDVRASAAAKWKEWREADEGRGGDDKRRP